MYGVLNNKISYFLKFPLGHDPIMLRCTNKKIAERAFKCLQQINKSSLTASYWSRKHTEFGELSEKDIRIIENEVLAIKQLFKVF